MCSVMDAVRLAEMCGGRLAGHDWSSGGVTRWLFVCPAGMMFLANQLYGSIPSTLWSLKALT
jgi:hypothetical protein